VLQSCFAKGVSALACDPRPRGDTVTFIERFRIMLIWLFSTGLLAVADHFSGNFLTDWAVEGLSIFLSLPRNRLNDVIVQIALLGAIAVLLIYLAYSAAKKAHLLFRRSK
jgi:hypothetical protein